MRARASEFIYLCVFWSRPTQTIDNSLFCLCFETNICIFWLCFETNICIFWLCFETNCCKNICVIQRFLVPLQRKIKLTYVSTKNYTRFAHLGSL